MNTLRTEVAIIGAGPAGLLLAHLLAAAGVESTVLEMRTREDVETTVRAGIVENDIAQALATIGDSPRVFAEGHRHDGIELRFAGESHRIDFRGLTGRGVWLYPQHEVLRDLIAARTRDGQDIRFGYAATGVEGGGERRPRVLATDPEGAPVTVEADFVVGADGSGSVVRAAVTGSEHGGYFREYPFAWFGILCEAPPSAPELIYSNSPRGFALISQRSETVQRMYLQSDPEMHPDAMSEDQIWEELNARVTPHRLHEGPIFQRDVLRFRSFVASSLRRGRVALVGDAAHTVPPTGAKGMNLALADVVSLAPAIASFLKRGDSEPIERYEQDVLPRIWKAQHFSWWMTSMLHLTPDATEFDRQRQLGELRAVTGSEAGRRYLAECYTGWPLPDAGGQDGQTRAA